MHQRVPAERVSPRTRFYGLRIFPTRCGHLLTYRVSHAIVGLKLERLADAPC